MKKIFVLLLLVALTASLSAYDLDAVKDSFQSFADETASALPLAASMGLNWNDAYAASFPILVLV